MPELLRHHTTSPHIFKMHVLLIRVTLAFMAILCLLALTACPQDQTALQGEALQLKKQTAKLESVIQSLQEGNKVLQQQINRLNQEARQSMLNHQLK